MTERDDRGVGIQLADGGVAGQDRAGPDAQIARRPAAKDPLRG